MTPTNACDNFSFHGYADLQGLGFRVSQDSGPLDPGPARDYVGILNKFHAFCSNAIWDLGLALKQSPMKWFWAGKPVDDEYSLTPCGCASAREGKPSFVMWEYSLLKYNEQVEHVESIQKLQHEELMYGLTRKTE